MLRAKSSPFAFSVLSFALLFAIGLTAPALAKAQSLKLNPTSLNFGNVVTGTTSPAQTVFATNIIRGKVKFFSIIASAPFLKVGDTCDGELKSGQTCHIDVACQPTTLGAVTGTLTFVLNRNQTEIVGLTCTGVSSGATPTATATSTATATPTATSTGSATATPTSTATATATPTSTSSATATPT